jgi:formate C-acetyltransferase
VLTYTEVRERFSLMMDWLARLYINTLNMIHYMHDKYFYERIEMALHDRDISRSMATGIAGLTVVDYETEGDFPTFGNNDELVDAIAREVVEEFMAKLKKHKAYRNAEITMSILTIPSNVVYGKKTGNTPDGRRAGEPFAPGANPMHGRDTKGALGKTRQAQLTIRVSGYAVNFVKLTREQQLDVINRTFHACL